MHTADSEGVPHGALVLRHLVEPWKRSQRVVCADSYFASVFATEYLRSIGFRFIGVVKTTTRRYRMKALAAVELQNRWDRKVLLCLDEENFPKLLVFVWMDRNRRCFISSCSSLALGSPYRRVRWRQVEEVGTGVEPERLEFEIPQPMAAEIYCAVCGAIDQHNRCLQDDLQLERNLRTMDWSMRVNCSVLGMCIVDSWLAFSGCKGKRCSMKQADIHMLLSEELIDNSIDTINLRMRTRTVDESGAIATVDGTSQSGIGAHLTPTKRRRKNKAGEEIVGRRQERLKMCKTGETTLQCSICREEKPNEPELWICTTRLGSACFPTHLSHNQNL